MSERKWTPGPWIMGGSHIYTNSTEPSVAVIVRHRDEWEGNAHLIAAAPDLFEALEETLRVYVELAESGDAGFWDPEIEAHVKAARAALAKARGEV